ncbi:MAG TPA: hypothetical protein VNB22_06975 [Pyrinomonadaceae bacterium]|nr:hypothetical protein [Pyrinomonadaceae bacterium]
MKGVQIRKLNKYQAESAFMTDNVTDFPRESPGEKTVKRFDEVITLIQTLAGQQSSQAVSQNIGIKDDNLAALIKLLQKMNRAANAMAEDVDGIEDLFRMPRRRSEAIWLATARAFHTDSAPFESEFQAYDLPATFRADLLALITAVEQAGTDADIAGEHKGGATGGLTAAFQEAGILSRRLNAIVQNKYIDNPQKLAAWSIASHLEAAPKRSKNNGNTTPTPSVPIG